MGSRWPGSKRITILLSPADLAKRGTHFDLAIAVAVLAAHDRVKSERLPQSLFVGELTLTGGLRCVHGVLPMVLAAARHGIRQVFVPEPQVREAAMVPGVVVFGHAVARPGGRPAQRRGGARGAARRRASPRAAC